MAEDVTIDTHDVRNLVNGIVAGDQIGGSKFGGDKIAGNKVMTIMCEHEVPRTLSNVAMID